MANPPEPRQDAPGPAAARPFGRGDALRRVLVVDDSRMQRRLIARLLQSQGLSVQEAGSLEEALALAAETPPDLVLSDWVMPGGDGLRLCAGIRAAVPGYVYFILMSSRTDKQEISEGLEAGADDFLTKPVHVPELFARLAAGVRVLDMERRLKTKARLLAKTLGNLRRAQAAMDRDLDAARRLQERLLPERHRAFGGTEVSVLFRSAGHLGGDLVGFFPINARRIGLYSLDVSGHGVASALVAAQLAGRLSAGAPERNLALFESDLGIYDALPPDQVAAVLNRLMLEEFGAESYATLLYADLDLVTGRLAFVQAGHPHPLLLRGSAVTPLGAGGYPIGLIPGAGYQKVELMLTPGDRLLILSDGLEDATPGGAGAALAAILEDPAMPGPALLAALEQRLMAGATTFADDVSALLIDFRKAKPEG